jgi:hypothetical protein
MFKNKTIQNKQFSELTLLNFKRFQVRVLKLYPNLDIPNHKEKGENNTKLYFTLKGNVAYLVKKHISKGNNFIKFRSDNQYHKIKVFEDSLVLSINWEK